MQCAKNSKEYLKVAQFLVFFLISIYITEKHIYSKKNDYVYYLYADNIDNFFNSVNLISH